MSDEDNKDDILGEGAGGATSAVGGIMGTYTGIVDPNEGKNAAGGRRFVSPMYGKQSDNILNPSSGGRSEDINTSIRHQRASDDAVAHGDFSSLQAKTFKSDERLKKDIKPTLADKFMDGLHPASYRYKDPKDEPGPVPTGGRYLGIMAQDAEKIPEVGHQLVIDTPRGKMIAQKPMLSAAVAGLARLNERIKMLEAEKGKRA
jgi:hypothetical protein